MNINTDNATSNIEKPDIGRIAFSTIYASFMGFMFTSDNLDFDGSIILFFCYVIGGGIILSWQDSKPLKNTFFRVLPASLFLSLTPVLVHTIRWIVSDLKHTRFLGSSGGSAGFELVLPDDWGALVFLAGLGFVLSALFLFISSLASRQIIYITNHVFDIGPEGIERTNKIIKGSTAVIVAVSSLFVLVHSFF